MRQPTKYILHILLAMAVIMITIFASCSSQKAFVYVTDLGGNLQFVKSDSTLIENGEVVFSSAEISTGVYVKVIQEK